MTGGAWLEFVFHFCNLHNHEKNMMQMPSSHAPVINNWPTYHNPTPVSWRSAVSLFPLCYATKVIGTTELQKDTNALQKSKCTLFQVWIRVLTEGNVSGVMKSAGSYWALKVCKYDLKWTTKMIDLVIIYLNKKNGKINQQRVK